MRVQLLLILVVLFSPACGVPLSPSEFDETAEAIYLTETVERLQAKDYAYLESQMDERAETEGIRKAFEEMAALLSSGPPIKTEPVNWFFRQRLGASDGGASSRTAEVAIEYTFPASKWVLVSARLSGAPGQFRLLFIHVQPLPGPLAELNAFTFTGKGFVHYAFFAMTLGSIAVSLVAFVRCLRSPVVKRKWLWAIMTLIGFTSLSINWTNGAVSGRFMALNLPTAGLARAGWLGPWNLTFLIPIGALLFLWKHRTRRSSVLPDRFNSSLTQN